MVLASLLLNNLVWVAPSHGLAWLLAAGLAAWSVLVYKHADGLGAFGLTVLAAQGHQRPLAERVRAHTFGRWAVAYPMALGGALTLLVLTGALQSWQVVLIGLIGSLGVTHWRAGCLKQAFGRSMPEVALVQGGLILGMMTVGFLLGPLALLAAWGDSRHVSAPLPAFARVG